MANRIAASDFSIDNDGFYGREEIYTSEDFITADNVLEIVNRALATHCVNLAQEERLFWYRRGIQPILVRRKRRNTYVNNKVVDNTAEYICSFKKGYFLPKPPTYIARNDESQDKVLKLNEYMYRGGKDEADDACAEWFITVGKGVVYVEANADDDVPVKFYAIDPRKAFVVYSINPGNYPVMGVNAVTRGKQVFVDVYTRDTVFRLRGGVTMNVTSTYNYPTSMSVQDIIGIESNPLGEIPIVEYRYNAQCMSAFEPAMGLLNCKNLLLSNRIDGVEQFIQSLLVLYNADLPEGEDATTLREKGILILKSIGDQKSDINILSEQLNQTQTQTLVDNVDEEILKVCSMPVTQFGQTSSSDNQGAVLTRNGWYQVEAANGNIIHQYKRSNEQIDRIVVKILAAKGLLELKTTDFEIKFARNEQSNMVSKSQALMNLLSAGLDPSLALSLSGVSNDPASDYKLSEKWILMKQGNPDGVTAPAPTEKVIENVTTV